MSDNRIWDAHRHHNLIDDSRAISELSDVPGQPEIRQTAKS